MILFYSYYVSHSFYVRKPILRLTKHVFGKITEASSLSILLLHEPLLKHDDNVKAA